MPNVVLPIFSVEIENVFPTLCEVVPVAPAGFSVPPATDVYAPILVRPGLTVESLSEVDLADVYSVCIPGGDASTVPWSAVIIDQDCLTHDHQRS